MEGLIHKYYTHELMHVAADIALKLGASFYDSLYLALASTRRAVLATFDKRLAGHAEKLGVPVAPLSVYTSCFIEPPK